MQISDYLLSIDPIAKKMYLKRLEVLGLTEKDDPYLEENQLKQFSDSMSAWPRSSMDKYMDGYFIRRPGVYSQQELLDWKSLQAYNFFQSGFVQTVLTWTVNSLLGVVTAKVNPSMKSPNMAYELWIAVEPSGTIIILCFTGFTLKYIIINML